MTTWYLQDVFSLNVTEYQDLKALKPEQPGKSSQPCDHWESTTIMKLNINCIKCNYLRLHNTKIVSAGIKQHYNRLKEH